MHKMKTYFSKTKVKGVGNASLDRGISLVIAGIVLASVVAGISWLYDQYTYKKFFNDFSMYGIAVREYHKGSEMLKGDIVKTTINLENIKKVKLLPKSKNVAKIAHYDFQMQAYRNRLAYIVSNTDNKFCRRMIQAVNNKEFANKIVYLENQDKDRLYSVDFNTPNLVDAFCPVSTKILIAELIIRNQL